MTESPYALPNGQVQIAFSGGRTSAYMLRQIMLANDDFAERVKVVFTNTGREVPETLDFVRDVADHWGVPIYWLEYRANGRPSFEIVSHETASRDGRPFEEMIRHERYVPNVAHRTCTKNLKVLTAKRFLVSAGWKQWTTAIGIRADEAQRIKEPKRAERWVNWHPLAAAGVTKGHITAFWARQNFDLRLKAVNGSCPDGNCDNCFLKSESHRADYYRRQPARASWWSRIEQMATELVGKPATFRKGESYSDLYAYVDVMGPGLFDDEAFLCQADGGECFA